MNVFQYSAVTEQNWKYNLGDMTDWKPSYTFYGDFSIAEFCEIYMHDANAVRKTYNNVIKSWGSCYKALTEIIMVLNHKAWSFDCKVDSSYLRCSETNRLALVSLYSNLYDLAVKEFFKRYGDNDEAKSYYYQVTD